MRRIALLSIITAGLLNAFSCKNEDFDFPDFDYTTVYFPFQYPVRTLVLGDYDIDNSNDNQLKFLISARVAGMYENHSDWNVDFTVDPNLTARLATSLEDTIQLLPSAYYTLNPVNELVIGKGDFVGSVEVQLTDAFLDDTMAYRTHYAIPLRITGSTADSVLSGRPAVANPDPRIAGNWTVRPKDFTVFGIKFVNAYHGKYLHRGKSVIKDASGAELETIVYRTKYLENNEIWSLKTVGRNTVSVSGVLRSSAGSPGNFTMDLLFDANGNCTIEEREGSAFPVSGNGRFVKDGDEWGNKKRNAIHLNYLVREASGITHTVTDTLVFRDKDVRFEEFLPVVINN